MFQVLFLSTCAKKQVVKILVGMLYTFIGLTLFLDGRERGLYARGQFSWRRIWPRLPYHWILVPLGMLIGYFIVKAEPAVLVLNKQVEEITDGAISQKVMMIGLSVGMAAVGGRCPCCAC